jgi:methionyl-tRNA formyltransferase
VAVRPPTHPRRLVFLGTPEAAVAPLRALHAAGFEVALVVSRTDARRGRGSGRSPSPVKQAALDLGLAVTDQVDDVIEVGADLGVVVAFGRLIKPHVLAAVPMVNLHFSLLPRWRGAAPVERAILAGDERTGVCLMDVDEGLDTGGVRAVAELAIGPDETADELRSRLVDAGTAILLDALRDGIPPAEEQRGEPTYADKVTPDDLALDWGGPAVELHRVVRVGGAHTTFRDTRLKVWHSRVVPFGGPEAPGSTPASGELHGCLVGTGDGWLELVEVQPEGRGRQRAADWLRGVRPPPDGERLGR